MALTVFGIDSRAFALSQSCASQEFELTTLERQAREMIGQLKQDISNAVGSHGEEIDRELKRSLAVLECTEKKIEKTRYTCHEEGYRCGGLAWIKGLIGGIVRINNVHLCSTFWGHDEPYQAAVLVHEYTHVCKTSDAAYFHGIPTGDGVPRSVGKTSWAMIADTYRFWAAYGFCVPGTCEIPKKQRLKITQLGK